jgi:hypothetical protein
MSGAERLGRDRRRDRRYNCSGRARIWSAESEVYLSGSIVNLSMGGCLLQVPTPDHFTLDAIVEASFQSSYLAFRTLGSVRRVDPVGGLLGLQYQNLSLRGRLDLGELFVDLDALLAEAHWHPAAPRPSAHPQSSEARKLLAKIGPFLQLP